VEDLLGFLFFLFVFIIGPILGQKRKGQQQAPQQRPRQAPPAPPVPSRTEELPRQQAPQSAAEMLPDELWEILTGQKRPAPIPVPPTRYEEEEPDEEAEFVEVRTEEIRRPVEVIAAEERSLETYEPREVPVVVSMETLPPSPRVRHEEFHRRIATAEPAPVQAQPAGRTAAARLTAIAQRGRLRDVIALQEILGRPKGLE